MAWASSVPKIFLISTFLLTYHLGTNRNYTINYPKLQRSNNHNRKRHTRGFFSPQTRLLTWVNNSQNSKKTKTQKRRKTDSFLSRRFFPAGLTTTATEKNKNELSRHSQSNLPARGCSGHVQSVRGVMKIFG